MSIYALGNIAVTVFNMADRPVNVVNTRLEGQFEEVFSTLRNLAETRQVGVVVFASGKRNSFIVGADFEMLFPIVDSKQSSDLAAKGQSGFNRVRDLGIPSIAAINGPALGAGLELALACTYRVCGDNRQVQIGLPEVKLGLLPGSGGTVKLPKIVGLQEALKIILPGGAVRAKKAKKIGLVDAVLPGTDQFTGQNMFWRSVIAFADKKVWAKPVRSYSPNKTWGDWFLNSTSIGNWMVGREAAKGLDKMAKGKYPAPYFALDSAINAVSASEKDAEALEAKHFGRLTVTPQSKALISLVKMMNGSKKFEEKCGGAKGIKAKFIGVVGAGVMGAQIAVLCAKKGFKVYMRDIKQEFVNKGLKLVRDTFEARVRKGRMTQAKAEAKIALVQGGTDVKGFAQCDMIIEAAVEMMRLKKKIFQELETITRPDCVLATNTSSLSISELATVLKRPERCVGVHFFNPVGKMPLVEIISGPQTSADARATGYRFAMGLGKIPVLCKDCPGFVVNRILGIYMGEATKLAIEGNALPKVDNALLDFGMPMGPFRLMDEVGLDVAAHVAPVLEKGLGKRYASDPRYLALAEKNSQFLGKKTGKGFYVYKGKKQKQSGLNTVYVRQLEKLIKKRKEISARAIADRCVLVMLNEACMILEEGMVASPKDLDLAMVMGTGFAPFTGGLLAYADAYGIEKCVKRMKFLEKKCGERFRPHPMLLRMASAGERFHPERPKASLLRPIGKGKLPRSKL